MRATAANLRNEINRYYTDPTGMFAAYVEGPVHSGKTRLVNKVLNKLDIEVVRFRGGQIKGKEIVRRILPSVLSRHSVISLFHSKPKELLVWIDDVTAMLNSDKAGLSVLIQFLKKLKSPSYYVILSGRTSEDKRIADLRAISSHYVMPRKKSIGCKQITSWRYVHSKALAKSLMSGTYRALAEPITDVSVTALTWHENLGSSLDEEKPKTKLDGYLSCLNNLVVSDLVAKSSLTNKLPISSGLLLAVACKLPAHTKVHPVKDFKFTKAITKFSTFHNNCIFLSRTCCLLKVRHDQIMDCDSRELELFLSKKEYRRIMKLRLRGRDGLA